MIVLHRTLQTSYCISFVGYMFLKSDEMHLISGFLFFFFLAFCFVCLYSGGSREGGPAPPYF